MNKYKDAPTFIIDYYFKDQKSFYSGKSELSTELKPGNIRFYCRIRLWEGNFGSKYNGYYWLGRSENFNLKLLPGSTMTITITEIKPYKSLRGGMNGIFRVARRALGDNIPELYNDDTYPINIRLSIQ